MTHIKKGIALILIIFTLTLPAHYTHAGVWGENFPANAVKQLLEEISIQIREGISSAAKMAAIKQATSMIESALYGDSSSPRNISNYYDFIISDPTDKTITYAEDFLTNTLRGTTSGDYTSSGGGSLSQSIEKAGQNSIDSWKGKIATVNYAEHCPNGIESGDINCLIHVMQDKQNNPIGMTIIMDAALAGQYEVEQKQAELIATSTGVLPTFDEDGKVKLPSALVNEVQLQQVTLPLQALANGDSGVFSSAIQSFAVGLIMNIVNEGIQEASDAVDKNMNSFNKQYDEQMGELSNTVGPALEYSNNAYTTGQKAQSTWKNPDTNTTQTEDRQSTPGGGGGV